MTIEVQAKVRDVTGTSASRRLRRSGRIPGILYGNGDVKMLDLDHREIYYKLADEKFQSSILNLNVDGNSEQVIVRDYEMHPFRRQVMHIDFQRVADDQMIQITVPLHFTNIETAPGVKTGGGKIKTVVNDIEVRCLPKDLPESIEVDLGFMTLSDIVHLKDLKLPEGVEAVTNKRKTGNLVIANIKGPRGGAAA